MTCLATTRSLPRQAYRQQGGVLVIAMILLVVIGLTALASMRHVLSNERVVNNLRLEALAQQFAEMALRYCEGQMRLAAADRSSTYLTGLDTVAASGATGDLWRTRANWPAPLAQGRAATAPTSPAPMAIHVPDEWVSTLASASQPFTLKAKPQCFVERLPFTNADTFRVTARGFSPDYVEDATSQAVVQGSVVWLQSDIGLGSTAQASTP